MIMAWTGTYAHGPVCGTFNSSAASGKNTTDCGRGNWFDTFPIIPAAIQVHAAHRVRFANCSIAKMGATGIAFDGGSQNCSVASSLVEDVSGNGIQIGSIDTYNISDPGRQDAGNVVVDSIVRNVGREWLGTCGIIAFYSRGTQIKHNQISHVPYTGM